MISPKQFNGGRQAHSGRTSLPACLADRKIMSGNVSTVTSSIELDILMVRLNIWNLNMNYKNIYPVYICLLNNDETDTAEHTAGCCPESQTVTREDLYREEDIEK